MVAPVDVGNMAADEPDHGGDLERVLNEGYLEEETAMDTDLSPEPGQQTGELCVSTVRVQLAVRGYGKPKIVGLDVAM